MEQVSVNQAILRGYIRVYGPFFPLVLGVPLLAFLLKAPNEILVLSVPLGIGAAWLWWSYQVPIWRLWALRHVEQIAQLHARAVLVGLEWPYGSIFERTEIKSAAVLYEETTRSLVYYLKCLDRMIDSAADPALYQAYHQQYEAMLHVLVSSATSDPTLGVMADQMIAILQRFKPESLQPNQPQAATIYFAALHFSSRMRALCSH